MKNTLLKFALCAGIFHMGVLCQAQNLAVMPVGSIDPSTGLYSANPATTLVVDLDIRQESITAGPYARFAQKFFGVIAPLSDKELFAIVDARVQGVTAVASLDNLPQLPGRSGSVSSHLAGGDSFGRVQYDKQSLSARNAEDAAKDAAQAVFNIRKRRAELVMGDVGENVYGAGMAAALERLDQMENNYLELFFGKNTVTEYTVRLYVVPEAGKESYMVCRFSDTRGVLDNSDLSGAPLLVELRSEGAEPQPAASKSRGGKGNEFAVAENVTCTVTDGARVYGSGIVPVFQLGRRIFM